MYDEIVAGMRRQLSLIESALNRPLTDRDEVHELGQGIFYLNPEEIVKINGNEAERVSFFLLDQEIQQDIFLNYARE